jgi:hypothetical protein
VGDVRGRFDRRRGAVLRVNHAVLGLFRRLLFATLRTTVYG